MIDPKRVVVTGATSGLGREMALQLGKRGWRVAITGRREALLREAERAVKAAGGDCLALEGSVTEPETVRRHYGAIREKWGGLDWAILNAGINQQRNAREFDAAVVRRLLETNVLGAAYWLEAVLPDMIAAQQGTVAGISSLAAWKGFPGSGAYCASKAALAALLESARVDLRGTGVRVVTVFPGFVRSAMSLQSDPRDVWFMLEAEDGVRRILRGIEQGRRIVHFPWQLSCPIKYLARNMPGFLYDRIAAGFKSGNLNKAG